MKKIISLFLVWVFLFNVIGYYGIYVGMMHSANNKVNRAIENDAYDQSETVTIKIPLTLPYPIEKGFERVSGDFQYNGEFYKLVQQKYENDTVYVVCLRNDGQKKAVKILSDLVKQSTSQSPATNSNAKTLTGLLKDYNPVIEEIELSARTIISINQSFEANASKTLNHDYPVLTPPPNNHC
ncbi:MAG: hypothetical protein JST43_03855 [Bacteroidetes bacterium]|nr:hypothetical protein [Bacteroidota bacterium]MBS1541081.1 hypothetical protein [Bacteroidota bacterium]